MSGRRNGGPGTADARRARTPRRLRVLHRPGQARTGPQDRVADIALDVDGTPERVELKQFDISQSAGRLAARGRIDLQPQLAWDLTATAQDFDPGAFAAEWRGKLGFDLASKGRMLEQGPEATAQLTKLRGELRGRPLSGNADVSVTPPLIASGTVALNSGKSELRFRGRRGEPLMQICHSTSHRSTTGCRTPAASSARTSQRGANGRSSRSKATRGAAICMPPTCASSFSAKADVDDPRNPQGSLRIDSRS